MQSLGNSQRFLQGSNSTASLPLCVSQYSYSMQVRDAMARAFLDACLPAFKVFDRSLYMSCPHQSLGYIPATQPEHHHKEIGFPVYHLERARSGITPSLKHGVISA